MRTVDFNYLPIRPGDVVLDLGCGEGRHAVAVASTASARVLAADLCYESVREARKHWDAARCAADASIPGALHCCVVDVYCMPFATNSFDVVIFSEVLEHLTDYPGSLKELRRVLSPGGLLGLSVPRAWPEALCWFLSPEYAAEPGGHVRIFDRRSLLKTMDALGFSCYHAHFAHALHSLLWWLKCMFWGRDKEALPVRLMHRLLVWQIMRAPAWLDLLERVLNPLFGKSSVMYFYQTGDLR